MLAGIVAFAGLVGYASAQCRSMSSNSYSATPLDICYSETYDGTATTYAMYKCEGESGAMTATKYTYSDDGCTTDETEVSLTQQDCNGADDNCFCGADYDLCDYAHKVYYTSCTNKNLYTLGTVEVIDSCSAYTSAWTSTTTGFKAACDWWDTEEFADAACTETTTTTTPSPTAPTAAWTPYPTSPTEAYTPAPTLADYPCYWYLSGCDNTVYSAVAPRKFTLALLVAVVASFLSFL